eukprot:1330618-Pleurochrysis_carterae.AAC.1
MCAPFEDAQHIVGCPGPLLMDRHTKYDTVHLIPPFLPYLCLFPLLPQMSQTTDSSNPLPPELDCALDASSTYTTPWRVPCSDSHCLPSIIVAVLYR